MKYITVECYGGLHDGRRLQVPETTYHHFPDLRTGEEHIYSLACDERRGYYLAYLMTKQSV